MATLQLHRRPPRTLGYTEVVRPGQDLEKVGLSLLRLDPGMGYAGHTGQEEVGLVFLGGTARVVAGDQDLGVVGGRPHVFAGRAHAVYIPCGTPWRVEATSPVEIAVCRAPASRPGRVQVVTPDQVVVHQRGRDLFQRRVEDIIAPATVEAERLIVGETYSQAGHWSSYPPHKHDVEAPPAESKMEEIYLFKIHPAQGFAVQLIYTADGSLDEAYRVLDGDVTLLPRGYHPVAAAPGYQVYYLWAICGDHRDMRPNDDPAHAWVKNL